MTQFLSQFKRIKSCDMVLFFCVFLLVMIGLIMFFSTMSIVGQSQFDDGFFFIKRQFVFLSIGGLGLLTGLLIPHQLYKKYALYGYFLGVFLLIMTLIPGVGVKVGGAQRWIDSGFLLFQPIELVKFFLAVFFATAISNKQAEIHLFTKGYRLDGRFVCANGEGKLCGSYIETDDKSGLALKIEAFQL